MDADLHNLRTLKLNTCVRGELLAELRYDSGLRDANVCMYGSGGKCAGVWSEWRRGSVG
jgi:hypothetical protein